MFLTIYVSTATQPMSDCDLEKLLTKSRAWNEAENITGILLYKNGCFMQFLEGSRHQVLSLLSKIRADKRHKGMIVVLQEEHRHREFADWAMAYCKIGTETSMLVPGYSDYLDLPLTSEKFLTNPSKTLELLLAFKRAVPEQGLV